MNVYFRQTQWDPPNIDQGESSEQGDQDDMDLDTPPQEVLQTKVSEILSPICFIHALFHLEIRELILQMRKTPIFYANNELKALYKPCHEILCLFHRHKKSLNMECFLEVLQNSVLMKSP